jgi:hypothetical protein
MSSNNAAMSITKAARIFVGSAEQSNRGGERTGARIAVSVYETITPTVAAANNISASQTVTGAGTAFVLDGSLLSGGRIILDVARNVVAAWTNTAILTITGKDAYGATLVEVSASGTSHTGAKAFKEITSVTTSATITGATVGTGAVLGLKYRPIVGGFIRGRFGEDTADAGTYTAPIRTTSTSTSADVRGMYAYAGTANGTNKFTLVYFVEPGPDDTDLFGIAQYQG